MQKEDAGKAMQGSDARQSKQGVVVARSWGILEDA
jgi:hypothetical protein